MPCIDIRHRFTGYSALESASVTHETSLLHATITPVDDSDASSCAWLSYIDHLYQEFTRIANKHKLYKFRNAENHFILCGGIPDTEASSLSLDSELTPEPESACSPGGPVQGAGAGAGAQQEQVAPPGSPPERMAEAALEMMAAARTAADMFRALDEDGSGSLDRVELETLLSRLGYPMSKGEVDKLMAQMDEDGSNEVDLAEFRAWWSRQTGVDDPRDSIEVCSVHVQRL